MMYSRNKTQLNEVAKLNGVMQHFPGEEIPPGGWRGGEEIPPGGWRGGEEIPPGGWRGGEEIPPGGWREVAIDTYRTRDGEHYFKFRFVPVEDHFDVDILAMPSYGTRTSDLHATHRLPSERGEYKICFGDPAVLTDLNAAKKWAATWSELTSSYIKNGTPFPNT